MSQSTINTAIIILVLLSLVVPFALVGTADAFAPVSPFPCARPHTRLFLEDWVADMIDKELYRQGHKKDYEKEWMDKNRNAVLSRIETDFVITTTMDDDKEDFRAHRKDQKLAFNDPQRYCADRCISTGNCDIFEDFYDMSPEQVIAFCTECVLSESEDGECEIPEGFYDKPRP